MDTEPDFSVIAAAVGEPTRARMLAVLMDGRARTATELAMQGEVAASTGSAHLARLLDAGLLTLLKQGRHRYFRIAGSAVAHTIESLMHLAAGVDSGPRVTYGPVDPALREARVCYDHLAGGLAVQLSARVLAGGLLESTSERGTLTAAGLLWLKGLGLDGAQLQAQRRPLCRWCLDWSERREHLAGSLGAALLQMLLKRRWLRPTEGSRALQVTPQARRFVEGLGG